MQYRIVSFVFASVLALLFVSSFAVAQSIEATPFPLNDGVLVSNPQEEPTVPVGNNPIVGNPFENEDGIIFPPVVIGNPIENEPELPIVPPVNVGNPLENENELPIEPPIVEPPVVTNGNDGGSSSNDDDDESNGRRIPRNTGLNPLSNTANSNPTATSLTDAGAESQPSGITGAVIGVFGEKGALGVGVFITLVGLISLAVYNRDKLGFVSN